MMYMRYISGFYLDIKFMCHNNVRCVNFRLVACLDVRELLLPKYHTLQFIEALHTYRL